MIIKKNQLDFEIILPIKTESRESSFPSCSLVSCTAPSYAYDCNITRLNRGNIHDSPRRPAGGEIDS
ncbi:hypothetical protein T12_7735 [Trichinella patagoniensis]|uniref:Uncharacterized protein n=1 Tax=Trichinella patagoniensis TaxID=990121 RepID=A0A0V0Z5H7_9BILA|nr:hypothetical protein T12_7735 [Trichinella patagoniensis]